MTQHAFGCRRRRSCWGRGATTCSWLSTTMGESAPWPHQEWYLALLPRVARLGEHDGRSSAAAPHRPHLGPHQGVAPRCCRVTRVLVSTLAVPQQLLLIGCTLAPTRVGASHCCRVSHILMSMVPVPEKLLLTGRTLAPTRARTSRFCHVSTLFSARVATTVNTFSAGGLPV